MHSLFSREAVGCHLITVHNVYYQVGFLSVPVAYTDNVISLYRQINTGLIRNNPYWISKKNSSELIELSSIKKLV